MNELELLSVISDAKFIMMQAIDANPVVTSQQRTASNAMNSWIKVATTILQAAINESK